VLAFGMAEFAGVDGQDLVCFNGSQPLAICCRGRPATRPRSKCATTGTNQTCTNSIFLSGGATGLFDTATVRSPNTSTGTIFGTAEGISSVAPIVTISGPSSAAILG